MERHARTVSPNGRCHGHAERVQPGRDGASDHGDAEAVEVAVGEHTACGLAQKGRHEHDRDLPRHRAVEDRERRAREAGHRAVDHARVQRSPALDLVQGAVHLCGRGALWQRAAKPVQVGQAVNIDREGPVLGHLGTEDATPMGGGGDLGKRHVVAVLVHPERGRDVGHRLLDAVARGARGEHHAAHPERHARLLDEGDGLE